ncbi:hypothetical protein B0H66DRAFT_562362 [Apodospora peruviana]|uniref:Transmembrane protein n=1 Tax=Apodospora peruviana TaxID=516989 RepID=A0AAE0M3T3_9PEZI|nr:hypothetical protein B0H66DRAFT_562362 [Apodospora peruviana]
MPPVFKLNSAPLLHHSYLPVFTLLIIALANKPAHALNATDFLPDPPQGTTVKDEIHCYALPYGAIGFASHILTYLTVLCLSLNRNPMMPWKRLKNRRWNLGTSAVGFLISFPLTVVTMVRCRNSWSFILIAVWKLVLSVTLTAMTVHAARNIIELPKMKKRDGNKISESTASMIQMSEHDDNLAVQHPSPTAQYNQYLDTAPLRGQDRSRSPTPYRGGYEDYKAAESEAEEAQLREIEEYYYNHHTLWNESYRRRHHTAIWYLLYFFYFLGAVVGFVGVVNVVRKNIGENQQLRIVTGVFGGVVLFIVLVVALLVCCASSGSGFVGRFGITLFFGGLVGVFVLTVLFAFYTDWVLAALAGDIVGRPSKDNAAFYWTYFAAKRLPMFSM